MSTERRIWIVALGTIALVLGAAVVPASAGAVDAPGPEPDHRHQDTSPPQALAQENNSTVRHENPEAVSEPGDSADVEQWLSARLSERLRASSVELSQGEYETARELVGEEYRERYGQYVDVAGETAAESETTERFDRAQQEQQQLVSATQEYRETYEAYQTARENGNQTRARTLARELQRLSTNVSESQSALDRDLENISQSTGANVSETQQRSQTVARNVSNQQTSVVDETFVRTRLTASVDDTAAYSFVDPLVISGQLRAANGTALANERVRLRIRNHTYDVRTNASGGFNLSYRPTTRPLDAATVRVVYVPANASIYLGANATVDAELEQVPATVAIARAPRATAFNRSLTVRGRVGAQGSDRGAGQVPVTVWLGDERLGTTTTAANGTYTLTARSPATVRTGQRTLRVSVPLEERALAGANATTAIRVRATRLNLSAAGAQLTNETIRVAGTLRTAAGEPVANRTLQLRLGDEPLASTRTDRDGNFTQRVTVPPALRDAENDTLAVTVVYADESTNLAATRATVPVAFDTAGQSTSWVARLAGLPRWVLFLGAAVVGLGLLLGGRRMLSRDGSADEPTPTPAVPETPNDARPAPTDDGLKSLAAAARSQLAAGETDAAVKSAYAATRAHLRTRVELSPTGTHWELYTASLAADGDGASSDALQTLVQTYERAAFAPTDVSSEDATAAVEAAETLTQEQEGT